MNQMDMDRDTAFATQPIVASVDAVVRGAFAVGVDFGNLAAKAIEEYVTVGRLAPVDGVLDLHAQLAWTIVISVGF